MELKEFIATAIDDIATATQQADEKLKPRGGLVNPGTHEHYAGVKADSKYFVAARTTLNFDIAVSATNSSSGDAGVKARIWVVEANLGGDLSAKHESISRLTFSIDVVLPFDENQADRIGKVRSPEK